jgi:PTS system cellobiose-specific IIC component
MAISFFIYLPFFKKQDAINLANEKAASGEN